MLGFYNISGMFIGTSWFVKESSRRELKVDFPEMMVDLILNAITSSNSRSNWTIRKCIDLMGQLENVSNF